MGVPVDENQSLADGDPFAGGTLCIMPPARLR